MRDTVRCWGALLAALAATACVDSLQPGGGIEPLVFPAEARLGGTAAIAIDSNFIPLADQSERYDLTADRVSILLDDGDGTPVPATVRGVFSLASVPSSFVTQGKGERARPWTTFALFDLPADAGEFDNLPPYDAGAVDVIVQIDQVTAYTGSMRITGDGGMPTDLETMLLPDGSVEAQLSSKPVLRLRGRDSGSGDGFQETWSIGVLELELRYASECVASPRAYGVTEASRANVLVGAESEVSPGIQAVRLVLIDGNGFRLVAPNSAAPSVVGEGPFLDVVFDAGGGPTPCDPDPSTGFEVFDVLVVDVDGNTLIDRRGSPTASNDLFAMYFVEP